MPREVTIETGSPWRSKLHQLAAEASGLPREQAYKRLRQLSRQATSEEDRAIIEGFGEALEMIRMREGRRKGAS